MRGREKREDACRRESAGRERKRDTGEVERGRLHPPPPLSLRSSAPSRAHTSPLPCAPDTRKLLHPARLALRARHPLGPVQLAEGYGWRGVSEEHVPESVESRRGASREGARPISVPPPSRPRAPLSLSLSTPSLGVRPIPVSVRLCRWAGEPVLLFACAGEALYTGELGREREAPNQGTAAPSRVRVGGVG
jgi:hypothetical protein